MGLDTTHDCWHGAYSAFTRWRNQLAEAAGYELGDATRYYEPKIDWSKITEANIQGKWTKPPDDPLVVIIAHSDCDGVIHPQQARLLADRLEELLPKLKGLDGGGHIGDYTSKTQQFIDGLRLAVSKNEIVDFH